MSHSSEPFTAIMTTMSALIVDDEPGMRRFLSKALSKKFARVEVADSIESAEELRQKCHFDVLVVDIRLPGRSGIEWHEALEAKERRADIIFMTGFADLEVAIAALRAGAADFIMKPFHLEQMMMAVDKCIERRQLKQENKVLQQENKVLRREMAISHPHQLIGQSAPMLELKTMINRIAHTNVVVLIQGESGTGKELVARQLHQQSGRPGSFVAVNCGAISPELLESELFGHAAGAFTGSKGSREGLFSYAAGGTIFLDEIGEMPLKMQTALLRVLQERTIRPVGSEQERAIDVRVIAATNRDLMQEVKAGNFREDLFYRLNVLDIHMPPLRDRLEDIPALTDFITEGLLQELGFADNQWTALDYAALQHHDWPGNIRELRNMLERCLLLGKQPSDYLAVQDPSLTAAVAAQRDQVLGNASSEQAGYPLDWPLKEVEKHHVLQVVAAHEGNKSAAARDLGVSRKTLDRKYKEWFEGGETAEIEE